MKNVVLAITSILIISFLGLLAWINSTPGFFQHDCTGVSYQKRGYSCQILPKPFTPSLVDTFLLWVAHGDLYR